MLANKLPRSRAVEVLSENIYQSQQNCAGNITLVIPRLRSGSVRLNNFVSQN